MEFLEKNIRLIATGFVLLIVVGLGVAIATTMGKQKEKKAQESLAQLEFDYNKYKEFNVQASMPKPPVNPKDKNPVVDPHADAGKKATELRTQLVPRLTQFISANEKTIASRMAALYLSELYLSEQKTEDALNTLKTADTGSKDLTGILVKKKMGSLLADGGKCEEALKVWDNLLQVNTAKFAHAEVKIMQSLCYQKMNDLKKAEEILLSVKNDKSESSAEFAQHAERILRLIQFKKASGS